MYKIFLTVDTESHDKDRENQYIWGKCKKGEYGIKRILEYGKEYAIPINFFVDFAEADVYGKDYISKIVNIIKFYDQPIFLHIHPNFISNNMEKTYLWQYSKDEQSKILDRGINLYEEIMEKKPIAFRAGRYGINKDTLDLLSEKLPKVIDFSYLGNAGKMCHADEGLLHTKTHYVEYKGIGIFPTTQFIALDILGIQKKIGVDASEMSLLEFKEFLEKADGADFVLTMHSWNFINKYFWNHSYVGGNRAAIRSFKAIVEAAKHAGYEFTAIDKYNFRSSSMDVDIEYNACTGGWRKIRSVFINFWRFQKVAKQNPKYLYIYSMFYLILLVTVGIITLRF